MLLNLCLLEDSDIGLIVAIVLTSLIIILALVAFVIAVVKRAKKAKMPTLSKEEERNEIVEAFGKDNILDVNMELSRITVKVKDVDVVNAERIKELGASGILLVGDMVKCSFKENVEEIYAQLKGAIINE
ncbi:MAG: hypothetical protein J6Y42_01715 [Bacilli bacterium]|nr:hypothetical protein [Bacilli bacterium]